MGYRVVYSILSSPAFEKFGMPILRGFPGLFTFEKSKVPHMFHMFHFFVVIMH